MSVPDTKMQQEREVSVRLASPADAEDISRVIEEAFSIFRENYTPEAFVVVTPDADIVRQRFDEGPMWVAEIGGKIIGTVSVTTEPEGLYVRSMAVSPAAQRMGVGHKLLDAMHEHLAASEIKRIFLYTTYFTPGAKEMYEKHGYTFVRDTIAEEWYGVPGLEMEKFLFEPQAAAGE